MDFSAWRMESTRENQLSGYMCLSRVEMVDGICIVQPYAPNLFRQGDLPGPNLLLQFWRGEIQKRDLEAAWSRHSEKKRKPNNWCWLERMPLYCRGCTEDAATDIYKQLKDFPDRGSDHIWDRVIALGMERFCKQCSLKRNQRCGEQGKQYGVQGKDSGVQGRLL